MNCVLIALLLSVAVTNFNAVFGYEENDPVLPKDNLCFCMGKPQIVRLPQYTPNSHNTNVGKRTTADRNLIDMMSTFKRFGY